MFSILYTYEMNDFYRFLTSAIFKPIFDIFNTVFSGLFLVFVEGVVYNNLQVQAAEGRVGMKVDKDFVLREIGGEYVIIPTGKKALEFNGLITVNEVGVKLLHMLQKDVTFDDLVRGILDEYDVEEEVAREDIQEFLDKLTKGGILKEDGENL